MGSGTGILYTPYLEIVTAFFVGRLRRPSPCPLRDLPPSERAPAPGAKGENSRGALRKHSPTVFRGGCGMVSTKLDLAALAHEFPPSLISNFRQISIFVLATAHSRPPPALRGSIARPRLRLLSSLPSRVDYARLLGVS